MTAALATINCNWLHNLSGARASVLDETSSSHVIKQDLGSPSGQKSILLSPAQAYIEAHEGVSHMVPTPGSNTPWPAKPPVDLKPAAGDKSSGLSTQQMVLIGAGVIALYYLMQ